MGKVISVVTENVTKKEHEFPKLMKDKYTSLIVLMIAPGSGCIVSGIISGFLGINSYSIGKYLNEWNMDSFIDFHGEVTLKNE